MNANRNRKNEVSPMALVLVLLFLIFPPFAIMGAVFLMIYKQGKKKAPAESRPLRADGQTIREAKEKFLRRLKEEDAAERPYKSHPHTPVSYSYDACAKEKRLEQLKVLKEAGLLDDMEYSQRKRELLAMG